MIHYFAEASNSPSMAEAIIAVASIFAFCFVMWLFFKD